MSLHPFRPVLFLFLVGWIGQINVVRGQPANADRVEDTSKVVYLHTEFFPYEISVEKPMPQRLGREMVRQAFAMTLRDSLGWTVRDETLDELRDVDRVQGKHLAILERADRNGNWKVRLYKLEKAPTEEEIKTLWDQQPIWERDYSSQGWVRIIPKITKAFETATTEEFLEAAKLVGLEDLSQERVGTVGNPLTLEQAEQRLRAVNFVSQWLVARGAHQQLASNPDDPRWLSVAARAYANLSLLTLHQWHCGHEVFVARSLLYAQRMSRVSDRSLAAKQTKAYCWSMTGLHAKAIEGLQAVRQSAPQNMFEGAPWLRMARLHALYDHAGLLNEAASDPRWAAWATRLGYQLSEPMRINETMFQEFERVKASCPFAFGAYATTARFNSSLGTMRDAAFSAPHRLSELVSIPSIATQFPASTANVANANPLELDMGMGITALPSRVANSLRTASSRDTSRGLSWASLAFLIEEEFLVQAVDVFEVLNNAVDSSLGPIVDQVLPMISDHRYAALIDSYRYTRRKPHEEFANSVKGIQVRDPRRNMSQMFFRLYNVFDDEFRDIGRSSLANTHRNQTYFGLTEHILYARQEWLPQGQDYAITLAREALAHSPRSELSIRMEILVAREKGKEQLDKWEQELKHDARSFQLLGREHQKRNRLDDALRCFKKAHSIVPTVDSARLIANLYWEQGHPELWEQTLVDYLQTAPDQGLEKHSIANSLSKTFRAAGQFKKAMPHAEHAAESYAAWGLLEASRVHEDLANWEKSEDMAREVSREYNVGFGNYWFLWCGRTGRGDKDAARELANACLDQWRSGTPSEKLHLVQGTCAWMDGKLDTAESEFKEAWKLSPDYAYGLLYADLQRLNGDEAGFQETCRTIVKQYQRFASEAESNQKSRDVVRLLLQLFGRKKKIDARFTEELDKVMLRHDQPLSRRVFAYLAGCGMAAAGERDQAETYWHRAMQGYLSHDFWSTLAGVRLSERNGTSRGDTPYKTEDVWPPVKWPPEPKVRRSVREGIDLPTETD